MSYLDHILACNRHDPARYRPFRIGDGVLGHVRDDFLAPLAHFPDVFCVGDDAVTLSPALATAEARTAAVAKAMRSLHQDGLIRSWRGEAYAVAPSFGQAPLMALERAAVPRLGVRAHGVHVNGFVREEGDIRLWIGRRALDREVAPGKLDNMIAGGQPFGLTLAENLVKEGEEEAGADPALMARAVPVGAVTYRLDLPEGLRNDVLFVFDLELPADFTPRNTDGEMADFTLMPATEVARLIRNSDAFKFNVNLVLIHFLIRHGLIGPEEPDYLDLIRGLAGGER